MADLAEVVAMIGQMVAAAVYPSGTSAPSVTGADIRVVMDWPLAADIDAAMVTGAGIVSVYPQGGAAATFQVANDEPYVVTPAAHGLTATVDDAAVTLSGTPSPGEFVSLIVNARATYSRAGGSIAAILAALAAAASSAFPGVAVAGSTITLPGAVHSLICRIGAPAVAGRVIHRQREMVCVSAWAPTPTARDTLAAIVDVALKTSNRITMPDRSQATIVAVSSSQRDEKQTAFIYRRNMIFAVEYATVETYPAFEVTSFGADLDLGPSLIGAVANLSLSLEGQD